MFGSTILDVTIGLILIYLLYSLLATSIQEIFATLFGLRARMLEKGIERMLEDSFGGGPNDPNDPFHIGKWIDGAGKWIVKRLSRFLYFFVPIKFFRTGFGIFPQRDFSMKSSFYNLPQIKYLGENKLFKKPSYIGKENFSKSMIDMLKEVGKIQDKKSEDDQKSNEQAAPPDDESIIKKAIEKIPDKETKQLLNSLLDQAKKIFTDASAATAQVNPGNPLPPPPPTIIDNFRGLLENWFDDTMNRVSGWYKRSTQLTLFIIGLILAISFNVDTFKIVQKLSKDKNAREQAVKIASTKINMPAPVKKDSSTTGKKDSLALLFSQIKYADSLIKTDIADANSIMAIGWGDFGKKQSYCGKVSYVICQTAKSPKTLLGFLITAIAISLGAPFWFDLLNKFMEIRNSGKKPEEKK